MGTISIHASSLDELDVKLDKLKNFKPTLGFVFSSDYYSANEIQSLFRDKHILIFGTSSREEVHNDRIYSRSISCLLMDIDRSYFEIKLFRNDESLSLGQSVSQWALEQFNNPQLLVSLAGLGIKIIGDNFVSGIKSVSSDMKVYGGLASGLKDRINPFVYDADGIYDDGVIACVFNENYIELNGVTIGGWLEIGTPKIITRSIDNCIYEIDHEPVLDVYHRYFNISENSFDPVMVTEYPLSLHRSDGTQVLRVVSEINESEKAVYYGGTVPEGSSIRFCTPNIIQTIEQTISELKTLKNEKTFTPDSILLFTCSARSMAFGSHVKKEIRTIHDLWPVPTAGFCTWGEIGGNEVCDFHNTTISLVMIKAKENNRHGIKSNTRKKELPHEAIKTDDLTHLSNEDLILQIDRLQKEKAILSNFLHLTSEDLDKSLSDVERERKKSDRLLLNILPETIADRLKAGEKTIADDIKDVSILFADLAGFTQLSEKMPAKKLVKLLNILFMNFDELTGKYSVEKIKTIGDAYMAAAGLPVWRKDHREAAVKLGKGMLKIINLFNKKYSTDLSLRIGINSGPVTCGVIGKDKFTYDLWGDAVNIASRMESTGITGKIQITESTYNGLKKKDDFIPRGEIDIKGKGSMKTFLSI